MELNPLCQVHEPLLSKSPLENPQTSWRSTPYHMGPGTVWSSGKDSNKGACWRTKWVRDLPTLPQGPTPISNISTLKRTG
ncbi:hypothetical protein J3F84DRAFT_55785 [Trichoderma pleuroticola]